MASDMFKPLATLLKDSSIGIGLSNHTVYCFDLEGLHFLAAYKNNVTMDNIDGFHHSWKCSQKEAQRLLEHFESLLPHLIRSTLSLNKTRKVIMRLTKPMADIMQMIETTVRINQDNIREMADYQDRGAELRKRLNIQRVFPKASGDETVNEIDKNVEAELERHANDITLKKTAIESKKRFIKEAENEKREILDAAARFGLFLKKNSITPYNDAMIEYLDHRIFE
jgi:hypothetical protein